MTELNNQPTLNYPFQKTPLFPSNHSIQHKNPLADSVISGNTIGTFELSVPSSSPSLKVANTVKIQPTFLLPSASFIQGKVLDQGQIGDCVCNAFAYAILMGTQGKLLESRLYHYAFSRILTGEAITDDGGTTIQDAARALIQFGTCPENVFSYSNNLTTMPNLSIIQTAKLFHNITYTSVGQSTSLIKATLQSQKNMPILIGILVYSSFMTNTVATTGIVPMPNTKTEQLEGGHCVTILGFNDNYNGGSYYCVNSWGTAWGIQGYFWLPYAYVASTKLCQEIVIPTFTY